MSGADVRLAASALTRGLDAGLALREVLHPTRRAAIAGLPRRHAVVAAVWPDGHGFSARLESPRRPGLPTAWVRWRDGLEVWRFPEDPALPTLPLMIEEGYELLGHRLGHRATLRSPDSEHVVHLRSPRSVQSDFQRWTAIHSALASAGVGVARVAEGPELHGFQVKFVRGETTGDLVNQARMSALGEVLARAHAVVTPPGLSMRGPAPLLDATVRQLGLAVQSRTRFTQWLERRLERWRLLGAPVREPARALVHGGLFPRHIVWGQAPVLLDWDRAGPGDPEEDLGTLAARLYRESGAKAAAGFAAFRAGYATAGGRASQPLFEHYARLALVRWLAILSLRETDQSSLTARQEEWAAWPEVVGGW